MDKQLAAAWVEDLRSGKYKQGTCELYHTYGSETRYCCLGVLLETCRRTGKLSDLIVDEALEKFTTLGDAGLLGEVEMSENQQSRFMRMNDSEKSFDEISFAVEEAYQTPYS